MRNIAIFAKTQTISMLNNVKNLDANSLRLALSTWLPQSWRKRLTKLNLTTEELHHLFDVDFDDGILLWKRRSADMFATNRSASIWNIRFAGKSALESPHPDGYQHGSIFGKLYLKHRVLLAMKLGYWPEYVDHINGNRADNRLCNLRSVTKSENGRNSAKPITNTSGHIGVSWNKRDKRWTAYITLNQKRKALGNFTLLQDAIECREKGELAYQFHPNHGRSPCKMSA